MKITSDLIRDLRGTDISFPTRMFYLWLILRFEYDWFHWSGCREYGIGRRQIFRYLSCLRDRKMIEQQKRGPETWTRII